MCISDSTDLHFWLTRSVGRCMGLSFARVMDEGRLTPDDYLELIHACKACPHVASCQHWLGGYGRQTTGKAPDFCPNASALDSLKSH